VTNTPVKVLYHDEEREFIVVDKPGSIVRPLFFKCSNGRLIDILVLRCSNSLSMLRDDTSKIPLLKSSSLTLGSRKYTVSSPPSAAFCSQLNRYITLAANRLDRLTSGLMIIPLSPQRARLLTEEFTAGTVKKEYVARVKGKFPE
jgi:23S rRNA-/tRNA-specific pseudouridylate synthase